MTQKIWYVHVALQTKSCGVQRFYDTTEFQGKMQHIEQELETKVIDIKAANVVSKMKKIRKLEILR